MDETSDGFPSTTLGEFPDGITPFFRRVLKGDIPVRWENPRAGVFFFQYLR
ncbi:hypothetical protein ZHAS_00017030 [Anopheles sinensis]|uniref:Uncharacterized protein n=1 Tax=Anopheles sinensis TaxID=74873 RepID=A0A084WFM7_ANOSI|nr:hypothetical protein ZHAS_00017030 [Anopheles sinensis]